MSELAGRASELYCEKKYQEAIIVCDSAVALGQETLEILLTKGSSQLRIHDLTNGEKTLTRAIQLFPQSAECYFQRATLYSMMEVPEKGIPDMRSAIQIRDKPDFQLQLAVLYSKVGEFEKAIEITSKLIKQESLPKYTHQVYYVRGYSYDQQSQFDLALKDFNNSLALNDRNGLVFYSRARVLLQLNKKEMACKDLEFAINLGRDGISWYDEAIKLKEENCE